MLYEYAVDPSVFESWSSYSYVMPDVSIEKGRFISQFPKDWKNRAKKIIEQNLKKKKIKPVEKKRLIEKLIQIDSKLFNLNNRSFRFDEATSWLENASNSDKKLPFQAIISKINPDNNPRILKVGEFDKEDNNLWNIKTQASINRNAEDMVNVAKNLIKISSRFIFIDPHFSPHEKRFQQPLKNFLALIKKTTKSPIIEYHIQNNTKNIKLLLNSLKNNIPQICPKDITIEFIIWKEFKYYEKEGKGKRLHPRFLLTELTGILYENGLDESDGDITPVLLLEKDLYKKYLSRFSIDESPLIQIDSFKLVGTA